ncbi:hypothetical protein LR48_Vigan197s001700 [Vigna angularis]|uniref:Uncharacterized protein n=2 Tax=Phaseolus angularis TaxID=3914 RepID=A0A0L9T5J4_PHAAN|nr:hypothetical protein LR48_Vigan197s001700 [Vigna angularis]BAT95897.1 hypothetical protein VIGAN_08272700 [Vigna angularis var. angularis]
MEGRCTRKANGPAIQVLMRHPTCCIRKAPATSSQQQQHADLNGWTSRSQLIHAAQQQHSEMAHESLHVQHAGSRLEQQQHVLGLGEAAVADNEKWSSVQQPSQSSSSHPASLERLGSVIQQQHVVAKEVVVQPPWILRGEVVHTVSAEEGRTTERRLDGEHHLYFF